MPMMPFSSEHLQILDHLPDEPLPRQRDAGRFLVIGEPVIVEAARRAARKRRGWRSPLADADALTLAHIYVRILDGRYSGLEGDAAKERRILADVDNCVDGVGRLLEGISGRIMTRSRETLRSTCSSTAWLPRPTSIDYRFRSWRWSSSQGSVVGILGELTPR